MCVLGQSSGMHRGPLQTFECSGLWGSGGRLGSGVSSPWLHDVREELKAGMDQRLGYTLMEHLPSRLLVDAGWTSAGLWPEPLPVVFPGR